MDTIIPKIPETESYDDAYTKVERYLISLRIENRRILSKLVYVILEKTAQIHHLDLKHDITTLAMDETNRLTSEWCEKVLGIKGTPEKGIPLKGRVAMLLANVPSKWAKYFLSDGELPNELVSAMREAYISAGPEFQKSRMTHRALVFNPATSILAEAYRLANRRPFVKWAIYSAIIFIFILLFFFTR
ncbi:MAG: hypothetical protein WCR55_01255 [Lentisphaerota bacterium]